ncbi:atlastin-like isoform X1 [Eriocheir sinensis]|uniref:atlastin-like isoform X1 n=2 Tax=Eriocheir sinensis TaxID=95602 RepID=UPI0021C65A3E|nr:atlastin-like isoform X1 [Eriocheir sinensis]XP_050722150.1 atlastin-like isoform X1 [Eriocheir sinensis]XP_050722255.1 atlastin-like isoform X1 [Eriocheir sinensis]
MQVEDIAMDGYPVPVLVQSEETGNFELDEEALEEVLLNPRIADKYVCVLAVAGAFRKGKSFLLDFLLRYMSSQQSQDWLGDVHQPLKGFKWRQGSRRETTGVLLWSEPFLIKRRSGEEIAVILMDTQGTFDIQSSMKDSTTVFALTTMVASVLVYNLMNNIQEDDLMNLQLFTSYGMMAQEDCDNTHPFQRLHFLVRDWGFPYEIPYGHQGGQQLLDDILQITEKQHPAHQEVRRDLRKCFRDINCYLMPHPGFKVIQKKDFDGRLIDIEEEFVKHLLLLVPRLLAPENLVKKEIGGQPIKARDLLKFFTLFMEVFKDNDLPEPTTLVEFAAQASSQAALEAGKECYAEAMEALVGGDRPFLKTAQMEAEHTKLKEKAIQTYLEKNKYGRKNQSVVEKYQLMLEEEIEKMYTKYSLQNEAKNVFKAARTPATLFCVLMFFYLMSGIFGLFGMYSFANVCNLGMGVFLIMLTVWAYVRYSGEYRDAGVYIDELATFLWENVIHPIYQTYMEKHLKEVAEQAAQQALSSTLANGKVKST